MMCNTLDCPALPKGWKRKETLRKSGLSVGKIDVYYYSPSGKMFRSKPQLARYLGESVDLSTFDFRTGEINLIFLRKSKRQRGTQFECRNDTSLGPPIRQTASIFKQPVTVMKTQESKVPHGPSSPHGSRPGSSGDRGRRPPGPRPSPSYPPQSEVARDQPSPSSFSHRPGLSVAPPPPIGSGDAPIRRITPLQLGGS